MGSSGFYEGLVCVKGVRVYKDLIAICMELYSGLNSIIQGFCIWLLHATLK